MRTFRSPIGRAVRRAGPAPPRAIRAAEKLGRPTAEKDERELARSNARARAATMTPCADAASRGRRSNESLDGNERGTRRALCAVSRRRGGPRFVRTGRAACAQLSASGAARRRVMHAGRTSLPLPMRGRGQPRRPLHLHAGRRRHTALALPHGRRLRELREASPPELPVVLEGFPAFLVARPPLPTPARRQRGSANAHRRPARARLIRGPNGLHGTRA